jgi:hypothetical protein
MDRLQNLPAALQHYSSAVAAIPESTLYRTNRAIVRVELGELEAALEEFKVVVALGTSRSGVPRFFRSAVLLMLWSHVVELSLTHTQHTHTHTHTHIYRVPKLPFAVVNLPSGISV